MKINSLNYRLLISASLVLTAFFALASFVLEQGFKESAEQALREKLQIHIHALLSAAELSPTGQLKMPKTLPEPRYSNPDSGLYAFIYHSSKTLKWRSQSALGIDLTFSTNLKPGDYSFKKNKNSYFILNYAVIWENETGRNKYYIFSVAEDKSFVTTQVDHFRTTLRSWLLFIGFILVLIQVFVLRWGLKPLRAIVNDLEQIEAGSKSRLDSDYPIELQGLADNINALISSERAHLERYRHTLADLAHSLKTPLAILRGCLEPSVINKHSVDEQITRMDEIVKYQLQKAAAKGKNQLTGKVDLSLVVEKIIESLKKVYSDKQIVFSFYKNNHCQIYSEEGDIYEIAGNLLDNASKWCKQHVRVNLFTLEKETNNPYSLLLQIEDDGPGIPEEKITDILKRGVRADENIQGHGIGMAVVNDLTELLGGQLLGERSNALGGMRWKVYLP